MVLKLFFEWWYTDGWKTAFRSIFERAGSVSKSMSLGILIDTLFSPWKQIVAHTGRTATLQDRFRAKLDNIISRMVGLFVRLLVLMVGSLLILVITILSMILAIAWPVIPWLPILFIFLGFQS